MKFNTALSFTLAGALWCLAPAATPRRRAVGLPCAAAVAAIAGLTLLQYAFGWTLHLDQLFVRDPHADAAAGAPGRMSAATAIAFLALASALLSLGSSRARTLATSQALSAIALLTGFVGVQAYVFGAQALSSFFLFSSMAPHTAILFVVAGGGPPHRRCRRAARKRSWWSRTSRASGASPSRGSAGRAIAC